VVEVGLTDFALDVVQAINDWQRGGDHKRKVRRGAALKAVCGSLPQAFRTCNVACYRQEAHEKDRVWQVLADNALPETIAAWTTDLGVAKQLKGGVPPEGLQGVIFTLRPPVESIFVNLEAVYADPGFREACERYRDKVLGYGDGIGKYGSAQREIVLEISTLDQAKIFSYGGRSSSRDDVAELFFGRHPSSEDLAVFDELCARAGISVGDWWLSGPGTRAVLRRMQPHIDRLKAVRR
jgi:hypothetical protein